MSGRRRFVLLLSWLCFKSPVWRSRGWASSKVSVPDCRRVGKWRSKTVDWNDLSVCKCLQGSSTRGTTAVLTPLLSSWSSTLCLFACIKWKQIRTRSLSLEWFRADIWVSLNTQNSKASFDLSLKPWVMQAKTRTWVTCEEVSVGIFKTPCPLCGGGRLTGYSIAFPDQSPWTIIISL